MHRSSLHIPLLLLIIATLLSCDRTPRGVLSVNDMADLIVDLQLAEAYIDTHMSDFNDDSSKLVIKQSVFRKHGITQRDYDSSLVWYAHNMEDYTKAYDKAVGKLQARYDKLDKSDNSQPAEMTASPGAPTHSTFPRGMKEKRLPKPGTDASRDSVDLWSGKRSYLLTQASGRGFIPFDLPLDNNVKAGDRYQLAYKLKRGGSAFKVSLNVDYTDGSTSQISRPTHSDGWIIIDVQSDTARQARRVYGYVSYDIKPGHTAYVDSLMLMRTRMDKSNYGFIHAQRIFEREK